MVPAGNTGTLDEKIEYHWLRQLETAIQSEFKSHEVLLALQGIYLWDTKTWLAEGTHDVNNRTWIHS